MISRDLSCLFWWLMLEDSRRPSHAEATLSAAAPPSFLPQLPFLAGGPPLAPLNDPLPRPPPGNLGAGGFETLMLTAVSRIFCNAISDPCQRFDLLIAHIIVILQRLLHVRFGLKVDIREVLELQVSVTIPVPAWRTCDSPSVFS